jgi:DNA-binding CsgD family transcriptional regulator
MSSHTWEQLGDDTPLVGRTREQTLLRDRLAALRAGSGSLVLIGGEAGIGKSSLGRWLTATATNQAIPVSAGACYDLLQAAPYGPWREAFSALAAATAADDPAIPLQRGAGVSLAGNQDVLFAQIREFLAARTVSKPLVILLEDLHWADPASIELLRSLARGLRNLPLLIVATYRADELTRQHALMPALPQLVRDASTLRLDLAPLRAEDIHALLQERYVLRAQDQACLAAYLEARSMGNPFYLTEILYTLEGERLLRPSGDGWEVGDLSQATVPPLVRQLIEARLDHLDAATRRFLQIAAVIGQEVPLALWQAAANADSAQIAAVAEQVSAAHFMTLSPSGSSSSFTHALVRETLYAGQPLAERHATHQQVATILAARPDPPASIIASHFASASDPHAIGWLIRAGEQALALYAARDAVAAFTRAHDLAGRLGEPLPTSAYHDRAAAYALLGEFDNARHDFELVLERARTASDGAAEWRALIDLGLLWSERDYERAGSYFRAAHDLARQLGDELAIARTLNRLGTWHVIREEPGRAIPLHLEALAIFTQRADDGGAGQTLNFLGMATYHNGQHAASVTCCERAITLLRPVNDRTTLSTCLAMLTFNGGDPNYVYPLVYRETSYWMACGEEALAIAREIGWPAGEGFARLALGTISGARGNFGFALDHLHAALASAEQLDHQERAIGNRCALGTQWYELLDHERAVATFEQALQAARRAGTRFWTNMVAAYLAQVWLDRARISPAGGAEIERAAAVLASVADPAGLPESYGERHVRFAQGDLALARGDAASALAIAEELLSHQPEALEPGSVTTPAGNWPGPLPTHQPPIVLKLRGDALRHHGELAKAEQAYRAARDIAPLFGFTPLLWRIDEARGQLYQAMGRDADAGAAFASARATLEEMAASLPDESRRDAFRARAAARLPASDAIASPLSRRELDVLRLIVDGCSDREIALALSISPRTVARHVTGILSKLDVPSRTAAATLAMRQQLV